MKKIFAFILAAMLIFAMPIVASASSESATDTEQNEAVTDILPSVDENATESEISSPEKPMTEVILEYFQEHLEEFSVIGTLIMGIIYEIRKHKKLNGSIGTLNNNAIAVAENSSAVIKEVLTEAQDIAKVVVGYKDEMTSLLAEIRKNAEERRRLEDTLNSVEAFLKTAKEATLELSNEVAELLVLANIPNSKKEELYARHKKAVDGLKAAEEVISNDGKET